MESISNEKFRQTCGKALMVLLVIIFYCIYSYIKYGYDYLNTLTFIASVICVLGVRRISIVGKNSIEDSEYKISTIENILLEQVLILLLGILSIYIFAVKGVWGLYKSLGNLSFIAVLFRVVIIILSYQLVLATSKIQVVLGAIKSKNITRK